MKILLTLFALLFILSACQPEGRVYKKHQKLSPDYEWLKKDSREFSIPIKDNSLTYNLSIAFRFANGYRYRLVKVKVTETSPSGQQSVKEYDLTVRDENDQYIGDAGFDIWDTEHLVEPNKKFAENGTYTYVIEHIMPNDPLNYAMEIGMVLDKL